MKRNCVQVENLSIILQQEMRVHYMNAKMALCCFELRFFQTSLLESRCRSHAMLWRANLVEFCCCCWWWPSNARKGSHIISISSHGFHGELNLRILSRRKCASQKLLPLIKQGTFLPNYASSSSSNDDDDDQDDDYYYYYYYLHFPFFILTKSREEDTLKKGSKWSATATFI